MATGPTTLNNRIDYPVIDAGGASDKPIVVLVYILPGDVGASRSDLTKLLFNNPLFQINTVENILPVGTPPHNQLTPVQQLEAYRVQWALNDARAKNPLAPVVIVKDSSVSNTDPQTLADIITAAAVNGPFDLNYLCKWQDQCQLYTDKKGVKDQPTVVIARTQSPNGVQSLLFSPQGRDTILGLKPMRNGQTFTVNKPLGAQLNQDIINRNLVAQCVVPNLLDFDITAAHSNLDYLKTQECQTVEGGMVNGAAASSQNTKTLLWFLILTAIILLLAWAAYQVGPK